MQEQSHSRAHSRGRPDHRSQFLRKMENCFNATLVLFLHLATLQSYSCIEHTHLHDTMQKGKTTLQSTEKSQLSLQRVSGKRWGSVKLKQAESSNLSCLLIWWNLDTPPQRLSSSCCVIAIAHLLQEISSARTSGFCFPPQNEKGTFSICGWMNVTIRKTAKLEVWGNPPVPDPLQLSFSKRKYTPSVWHWCWS